MPIHVLIIHPRLDFVVNLKQALERAGAYDVHSFTATDTAVDYLRYHPQDVALVDVNLKPVGGVELVRLLHAVQRDLAIVVSPRQPDSLVIQMGAQGSVDVPVNARQLIPVLDEAMGRVSGKPDDTDQLGLTRPTTAPPSKLPESAVDKPAASKEEKQKPLEIVLPDTNTMTPAPETPSTFQRLAAEEPPMPAFEDSGTVRDLRTGVNEQNYREVVSLLNKSRPLAQRPTTSSPRASESKTEVIPLPSKDSFPETDSTENIPAQIILETALDETTPLSLTLTTIQKQLSETNVSINEPDFLSEIEEDDSAVFEVDSESAFVDDFESVELAHPVTPPPSLPEIQPAPEMDALEEGEEHFYTRPLSAEEIRELASDFERLAAFDLLPDDVEIPQVPADLQEETPDPDITKLALRLTQASLELAAEAILLAKHYKIVAYAGTLPREEVEALREAVANDWNANPNEARIRFKTLPSSGKDYMLYSRRTEGDYTLTMIFGGALPLNSIRRQGQRILDALTAVPEAPVEIVPVEPEVVEEEAPPEVVEEVAVEKYMGTMTAYTCLWLLRDFDAGLSIGTMQALSTGLKWQLGKANWEITTLDVHEDYIYLFTNIPGELPGQEIIRDLKRRSAEITTKRERTLDPQTLWLDSYLVVTPGRDLTQEEIQQFIRFARM